MFELTTILKKSDSQVSCNLDEEVAILSLDKSVYFGLKGVGAQIWQALDHPHTVEDLCKLIAEGFDVEPARCREDVLGFLHDLQKAGLIEPVG